MPVLFRTIAIVMSITLLRAMATAWNYSGPDWLYWLHAGSYGWSTLATMLLWFPLAPYAIVQLWRCREAGRRLGILLNVSLPAYYVYFWVNWDAVVWFMILSGMTFALILMSPPAKRACQRTWTESQIMGLVFG